jgi:hypothetical protein
MPPAGFEHTISAGEQPPTYALDCAATGTGNRTIRQYKNGEKYMKEYKIWESPRRDETRLQSQGKAKEKRTLWKEVFHFIAALCLAIKQYYCIYCL